MTRFRSYLRGVVGTVAFVAVGWLCGCDNTLDPFIEDPAANPFYVYGYLDTAADTQFLRVEPIVRSYDSRGDRPPAHVTTRSPDGDAVAWRDSAVVLDDGTDGHLYFAVFRPLPGVEYDLSVVRSDGAETRASTRVPDRPPVRVDSARVLSTAVRQRVLWQGLIRAPDAVEVTYTLAHSASGEPVTVDVGYDTAERVGEGQWSVDVALSADVASALSTLGWAELEPRPELREISVEIILLSDAWASPEADFIDNGAGFFGAVGRFTHDWSLPSHVVSRLGLTDGQQNPDQGTSVRLRGHQIYISFTRGGVRSSGCLSYTPVSGCTPIPASPAPPADCG